MVIVMVIVTISGGASIGVVGAVPHQEFSGKAVFFFIKQ